MENRLFTIARRIALSIVLLLFSTGAYSQTISGSPQQPADPLSLWYGAPATNWMTQALPIGNGHLGGMVFGGISQDDIQLNENSLWQASSSNYGSYQDLGDLTLNFSGITAASNYTRWLDLQKGIAYTQYTANSVTYTREYFCSYPDNVMVVHLTSTAPSALSFSVGLSDARGLATSGSGNTLLISGGLQTNVYEARATVLNTGGSISNSGSTITVSNADSVTILLAAGTDYSATTASYTSGIGAVGLDSQLSSATNTAASKSFATLEANHLNDYQALFSRVSLRLNNAAAPAETTDQLVSSYAGGTLNNFLEILLFQYGRYLTIAASRDSLPSNLQGLWNNSNSPSWSSDYHADINVEMNYFATDIANLSECYAPYSNWIFNEALIQPQWGQLAASLGLPGWTVLTQNNIYGNTNWNVYYSQNAWLSNGLWRHYQYTLDNSYLSSTAYPVMKAACQFWLGRLVTAGDGKLVAPQGSSPEHGPANEDGVTFDQQLIWDLFTNTIAAENILGIDATLKSQIQSALSKLDDGMRIGDWGQLREWKYTNDTPGDDHRHVSFALCLYPGQELLPQSNSALATAIGVTLDNRGDGGDGGNGYGWDHAWKMALRARLFEGNHAYTMLKILIQQDIAANLFDIYGGYVFQIDANYGAVAGMSEMLLQCNTGNIALLPALPDAWPSGDVTGMRAVNNFTIDESWNNCTLQTATIHSGSGGDCTLTNPLFATGAFTLTSGGSNVSYAVNGSTITFATNVGGVYMVTNTGPSSGYYTLSASFGSLTVTPGSNVSTTITLNKAAGFSGTVNLSASNLPSGITASFSPVSTTGTSTLTLTASSTAMPSLAKPFTILVTGATGAQTHNLEVMLAVNRATFLLNSSNYNLIVSRGGTAKPSFSFVGYNGYSGAVNLSVSGAPTGCTTSLSSTTLRNNRSSSTLTITTSSSTPVGRYNVTVTGVNGSTTRSSVVDLIVQ